LSTLTKILIILLTISSFFLCGVVVTYVATASNYREQYSNLRSERDSLNENVNSLTEQLNKKIAEKDSMEVKLTGEISSLQVEIDDLEGQLKEAERDKSGLIQKVSNLASVIESSTTTTEEQGQLLKNTLTELNRVQTEQIKLSEQLDETTQRLMEQMAIIETLNTDKKRLLEEKSELQARLDKLVQPTGKKPVAPEPVTPKKEIARPVEPIVPPPKAIELKGSVSAVDLKNSIASISIGSAHGVKEGMKFHVTRGDKFICDVLIIDIDAEEAVGVLELIQEQPRVGDIVSTTL